METPKARSPLKQPPPVQRKSKTARSMTVKSQSLKSNTPKSPLFLNLPNFINTPKSQSRKCCTILDSSRRSLNSKKKLKIKKSKRKNKKKRSAVKRF